MYECAALSGQRRADYETTHLHGSLHATRPPVERPGQTHRDVIVRLPSAGLRAALRGRLQALLGLRRSHRAEGRGYGSSVKKPFPPRVALWTPTPTPHNSSRIYAIAATAQRATAATAPQKPTAGDCEPYYFDWLKCIDKCAMPHIMQKLK